MEIREEKVALVLAAHGSRREASNREVRELAGQIAGLAGCTFADVRSAFLELAEPSIPDGIGEAIRAGAERVLVLPYFLSMGRHVAEDIPAEVAKAQAGHPHARIELCDYLGGHSGIAQLLLEMAQAR